MNNKTPTFEAETSSAAEHESSKQSKTNGETTRKGPAPPQTQGRPRRLNEQATAGQPPIRRNSNPPPRQTSRTSLNQREQTGEGPTTRAVRGSANSKNSLSSQRGASKIGPVQNEIAPEGSGPKKTMANKRTVGPVISNKGKAGGKVPSRQVTAQSQTSQDGSDPSPDVTSTTPRHISWSNPITSHNPPPRRPNSTVQAKPKGNLRRAVPEQKVKLGTGQKKRLPRPKPKPGQGTGMQVTKPGPKAVRKLQLDQAVPEKMASTPSTLKHNLIINFLLFFQVIYVSIESLKQHLLGSYWLATHPYNLIPIMAISAVAVATGYSIQNHTLEYAVLLVGSYAYFLTPLVGVCMALNWVVNLELTLILLLLGALIARPLTFYYVIHSRLLISPRVSRKFLIFYITILRAVEYIIAVKVKRGVNTSAGWAFLSCITVMWIGGLHAVNKELKALPTVPSAVRQTYRKAKLTSEFQLRQDPAKFRLFLIVLYPGVIFAALKQSLIVASERECQGCFGVHRMDLIIMIISTPMVQSMLYKRRYTGMLTDLIVIALAQLLNLLGLFIFPFHSPEIPLGTYNVTTHFQIVFFYSPSWGGSLYFELGGELEHTNPDQGYFAASYNLNQTEEQNVTVTRRHLNTTIWTHTTKLKFSPRKIVGYHVYPDQLVRIQNYNSIGRPSRHVRIIVNGVEVCAVMKGGKVKLQLKEGCVHVELQLNMYKETPNPFNKLVVNPPKKSSVVLIHDIDAIEEEYRLAVKAELRNWKVFRREQRASHFIYHIYGGPEDETGVQLEEVPELTPISSGNSTASDFAINQEVMADLERGVVAGVILVCGIAYNLAEVSYLNFLWYRIPFSARLSILFTYFTFSYLTGWLGGQLLDQMDDTAHTVVFILLCLAACIHMIFGYKYNKQFPSKIE